MKHGWWSDVSYWMTSWWRKHGRYAPIISMSKIALFFVYHVMQAVFLDGSSQNLQLLKHDWWCSIEWCHDDVIMVAMHHWFLHKKDCSLFGTSYRPCFWMDLDQSCHKWWNMVGGLPYWMTSSWSLRTTDFLGEIVLSSFGTPCMLYFWMDVGQTCHDWWKDGLVDDVPCSMTSSSSLWATGFH